MSTIQRETAEPSVVTPSILDPRVERGAALLDEKVPGWAARVDVDTLALFDCTFCVLGQLFGDFGDGLDELDITGAPHGFSCPDIDYPRLEQDWRLAILSRRTA